MGFQSKGRYYWRDPDAGQCSGFVTFLKQNGDVVTVTREGTNLDIEVAPSELITQKQANAPRFMIASTENRPGYEPLFWSTEYGWVSMERADVLSIAEADNFARHPTVVGGYKLLQLPAAVAQPITPKG